MQGWFSPGQVFVLDEYCARNGVRGCHRHLCYLRDLLERAESGAIIDPTLLHYSFAFCASHVHGNRCALIPSFDMLDVCDIMKQEITTVFKQISNGFLLANLIDGHHQFSKQTITSISGILSPIFLILSFLCSVVLKFCISCGTCP